jgi:hypothetical protein
MDTASGSSRTAQCPTGGCGCTAQPNTPTGTPLSPDQVPIPWQRSRSDTRSGRYVITSTAGKSGAGVGETFEDLAQLGAAMGAQFEALSRELPGRGQQVATVEREVSPIASIDFRRQHDIVMADPHDWQAIERACDERRLPGGSLTAAPGTPGWCAPCETRDDVGPLGQVDGIVDLPTVIASRGCLSYPVMPDLAAMYSQLGFCHSAADYDLTEPPPGTLAGAPWARNKACAWVPCPEMRTCDLDVCGVCVQSSLLVERAYPALVEHFLSQVALAWAHRMNCRDINQMITQSTSVQIPHEQTGPGAVATVLEVIEFYALWLRYRFRLGRDASIETVLPVWLRSVLRVDVSKRLGIEAFALSDQAMDDWFSTRKVRVQWVMGLDEAWCDDGTPAPSP